MSKRNTSSALAGLVGLAQIVLSITTIPARIQTARRKILHTNAQINYQNQRIEESKQKMQVTAAEIALRNNKAVVTDLDIEIKKLQLLKLQRELGLNGTEFNPDEYSSDRDPFK